MKRKDDETRCRSEKLTPVAERMMVVNCSVCF